MPGWAFQLCNSAECRRAQPSGASVLLSLLMSCQFWALKASLGKYPLSDQRRYLQSAQTGAPLPVPSRYVSPAEIQSQAASQMFPSLWAMRAAEQKAAQWGTAGQPHTGRCAPQQGAELARVGTAWLRGLETCVCFLLRTPPRSDDISAIQQ